MQYGIHVLRMAVDRASDELLHSIDVRYGKGGQNLPFHARWHTVGVVRRTNIITCAMGLPAEERLYARLVACGHDVVQRWRWVQHEQYGLVRERDISGEPEWLSAIQTRVTARVHDIEVVPSLVSVVFEDAFMATVPQWDTDVKTMIQPHLSSDTHSIARAVALADINGAGMEGPRATVKDSRRYFCELYPDSVEQGNTQHMLEWLVRQQDFLRGREQRLEEELGNLQGRARDSVAKLFVHFGASYKHLDKLLQRLDQWPYADLHAWYRSALR